MIICSEKPIFLKDKQNLLQLLKRKGVSFLARLKRPLEGVSLHAMKGLKEIIFFKGK